MKKALRERRKHCARWLFWHRPPATNTHTDRTD